MKTILFLVMFIIPIFICYPQEFWESLDTLETKNFSTIAIDSKDVIYIGSYSKGIFRSTDYGANWQNISDSLPINQVHKIVINSQDEVIASIKRFGIYYFDKNKLIWIKRNSGLEQENIITDPYLLTIDQNDVLYINNLRDKFFKSTNFGITWEKLLDKSNLDKYLIGDIAVDNNGLFYCGLTSELNRDGLFKLNLDSSRFDKIFGTWEQYITCIKFNSENHIIFSTIFGRNALYRSTDNGKTFAEIFNHLDTNNISYTFINRSNHLYALAYNRGTYFSIDNGTNWTKIDSVQENLSIRRIEADKLGYLYGVTIGHGVVKSKKPMIKKFLKLILLNHDTALSRNDFGYIELQLIDESEKLLSNVAITYTNPIINTTNKLVTDEHGKAYYSYKVPKDLPLGEYMISITCSLFGFDNHDTIIVPVKVNSETSAHDVTINKQNMIFPNPAADMITLAFSPQVSASFETQIEIYNVLGEQVHLSEALKATESSLSIDVSHLSPGIYYLLYRIGSISESHPFSIIR